MSYDEELAARIRAELRGLGGLTEGRIREGLAFLINGNVALCAYAEGGLLVRVDPDEVEQLVRTTTANRWEQDGNLDAGWVRVGSIDVRTSEQLQPWVRRAVGYVSDLPPDETRGRYDLPIRPGDFVRVATPEQWAKVAAAREDVSPMPSTAPERERVVEPLVWALNELGAMNRDAPWEVWSEERYASTVATIGGADLDDVVVVVTNMLSRRELPLKYRDFDGLLADGSFIRAVDRLLAFRPNV